MIKRIAIIATAVSFSAIAELGPHPVERIRMGETEAAVNYKDKMSDGTFRDSQIIKPETPVYPVRIALVSTNDVPGMWQLFYAAYYESGKVFTNTQYVIKTQARDRLKTVPVVEAPPMPGTNAPPIKDALAHAKVRAFADQEPASTNKVVKMGKKQAREVSAMMANGKIVRTLSDGTVNVEPLRVAHTARVNVKSVDVKPPAGNKYNAKELAAFAAGVAATLAALGIKKVV